MIASRKTLVARLTELWPISMFHMKQLENLENIQRIFLRTEKIFHERYSKRKMIYCSKEHVKLTQYMKRKISPSLIFQIHGSSSFAQVFYHFIFVVVLLNSKQRLPEKRETQQVSMPIRIDLRMLLTCHNVMSSYCFTRVQKWKSFGLVCGLSHP